MDYSSNTMQIACEIVVAAIEAKTLTLQPDPRVRQNTLDHDSAQIARAFTLIHDAIYNEYRRISGQK
jgi:hypothetical protein